MEELQRRHGAKLQTIVDGWAKGIRSRANSILSNARSSARDAPTAIQQAIADVEGKVLGAGGIAMRPAKAIVGDVPEAIIPLDKLGAIMAGRGGMGSGGVTVQGSIIDLEGFFQAVGEGDVELSRRGRQRVLG